MQGPDILPWLRENLLPLVVLLLAVAGIGYVLVDTRPDRPDTGTVRVETEPAGAEVFVDDRLEGTTPAVIPNVSFGEHDLRIEKEGYAPVRETIAVAAREQTLAVALEATDFASLAVSSVPAGAAVRVDDKEAGLTPVSLDGLTPGRHEVVVEKGDFVVHRQTVVLRAGEKGTVSCELKRAATAALAAPSPETQDDVYQCVRLAHQQIVDNDFEGAAGQLSQALALSAGLPPADKRARCVRDEVEQAYWARYAYGDDEAVERCRDMLEAVLMAELKARPTHTTARRLLMSMLRESGHWDRLVEALGDDEVPVDRTKPREMAFYGQALVHADRADQALALLLPVYRRHRNCWELTYTIGLGHRQKGETVKARIKFKQALLHCSDREGREAIQLALREL